MNMFHTSSTVCLLVVLRVFGQRFKSDLESNLHSEFELMLLGLYESMLLMNEQKSLKTFFKIVEVWF